MKRKQLRLVRTVFKPLSSLNPPVQGDCAASTDCSFLTNG